MKYSFYLIFIFLFDFGFAKSQETVIKGKITDSLRSPIKYSSIGILNKSIGTVSNENGKFTLTINKTMEQDTLRISCLGYKSKDILIKEAFDKPDSLDIQLESFIIKLEKVIISSQESKIYTLGKLKTKAKNQVTFSMPNVKNKNLGTEIGKKINLGERRRI